MTLRKEALIFPGFAFLNLGRWRVRFVSSAVRARYPPSHLRLSVGSHIPLKYCCTEFFCRSLPEFGFISSSPWKNVTGPFSLTPRVLVIRRLPSTSPQICPNRTPQPIAAVLLVQLFSLFPVCIFLITLFLVVSPQAALLSASRRCFFSCVDAPGRPVE